MGLSTKKIFFFNFFAILICLAFYPLEVVYAQNCTQTLRNAQRAYDEGRIAEIPNILNICLKNGFSRDEKIRAYRLLTLSYLYQYEGKSAENTMLEFLKVVPDYKITPEDPAPFVKLYKQFRTWPIFFVGFKLGTNLAQPQATKGFTAFESNFAKNKSVIGFTFALNGEIFINNKISLNTGLNILINRSRYSNSGLDSNFNNFTGLESQTIIALPVSVSYDFYKRDNIILYGRLGLASNFLLGASLNIVPTNNIKDANNSPQTVTPPPGIINLRSQRHLFNISGIIGTGAKYKVGRNYIIFDASYWLGLNDMSRDPWDNAHSGANVFKYGYVSDSFRMNNMIFTIGYYVPVYKPKLLRKK